MANLGNFMTAILEEIERNESITTDKTAFDQEVKDLKLQLDLSNNIPFIIDELISAISQISKQITYSSIA